jgi:hypothetical protein
MKPGPAVSILPLLLLASLLVTSRSAAQPEQPAIGRSKNLLVRVSVTRPALDPDGDESVGSGIIVGYRADTVFIATARHLLCSQRGSACETDGNTVSVAFRSDPRRVVPAGIRFVDPDLDLAFLAVVGASFDPRRLPYGRLARRGTYRRNTELVPVGCSTIVDCWTEPLERGRVDQSVGPYLLFRLSGIEPGYSGGAVFLPHEEIVGMTLVDRDAVANAQAIVIDSVASHARAAGIPFLLRQARLPPRGYNVIATGGMIVGWTTLPRQLGYSGYSPVTGYQFGVSGRLAGKTYGSTSLRVTYSDAARVAAVSVGPELRVPLTRDPDHLPAFSYAVALRGTVARVFSHRVIAEYSDGQDSYPIYGPIDRTAVAPSLSVQPEIVLTPHVNVSASFTYEPYIGMGPEYPSYLALFALRVGVAR